MSITNKDIYDAINDFRKEMKTDNAAQNIKIDANTDWRNQVMGKMTILFAVIGIGINLAYDWVKEKLTV